MTRIPTPASKVQAVPCLESKAAASRQGMERQGFRPRGTTRLQTGGENQTGRSIRPGKTGKKILDDLAAYEPMDGWPFGPAVCAEGDGDLCMGVAAQTEA
ncbi:hypothetical protein BRADI_2g34135v3 [Brachypodium distachyon]|uniref:Uncharacterized protein n=1 Tax=Brachypodium distachyon TaxID=15368 RepID=A0A2K2DBP8_BRADI|nr:hypothetical protein BRADI_2g34135v3 [Brachypodium distachyon]